MAICKLCKQEKVLINKSHIIPEFLYSSLYDKKHRFKKINPVAKILLNERDSTMPKGEYESGLFCKECDGGKIGQFESYLGKILKNKDVSARDRINCRRIENKYGVEFTRIENINFKKTKLALLSILWRASLSHRSFFEEVKLGPYEEMLRKQIYFGEPVPDDQIPIIVFSWNNDNTTPKEIISQPSLHKKDGKTFYSIVILGYLILFYISDNLIPEDFKHFRLRSDNTLSIINLPKGVGMQFLLNYSGASHERNMFKLKKRY